MKSEYQKKKELYKKFIFLTVFFIFSFSFFSYAGTSFTDDLTDGFYLTAMNNYEKVYGNGVVQKAMDKIDKYNITTGLWKSVTNIADILQPVGIALLVMYSIIELTNKATTSNLNFEQIMKFLLKFILGKTIIENSTNILSRLYDISILTANLIATNNISETDTLILSEDWFRELKTGTCLAFIASTAIIGLIIELCVVLMEVSLFTRIIEICVKGSLSPIAFSDVMNGMNSNAFRYFKKFLGTCFKIVIILAIFKIYPEVSKLLTSGATSTDLKTVVQENVKSSQFFPILVLNISITMLVMKSQQMANDLFGV